MSKLWDLKSLKERMEEKGWKTLADFDRKFHKTTDNFGGIIIIPNSTGEVVFIQQVHEGYVSEITEAKVKADNEGKAYFKYEGNIYYAHEFMRIGFTTD